MKTFIIKARSRKGAESYLSRPAGVGGEGWGMTYGSDQAWVFDAVPELSDYVFEQGTSLFLVYVDVDLETQEITHVNDTETVLSPASDPKHQVGSMALFIAS